MTDIKIKSTNSISEYRQTAALPGTLMDWVQTDQGLSEEEELATAVRVAIGTDALADVTDVIPDMGNDRRGWWGDMDAEEIWDGWPIGCKNWLLLREKISDANSLYGATVMRAEQYTRSALQPFITRRICSGIDVKAMRIDRQRIDVMVTMFRGPKQNLQLRFQYLWTNIIEAG